jgi:hypothetical protein
LKVGSVFKRRKRFSIASGQSEVSDKLQSTHSSSRFDPYLNEQNLKDLKQKKTITIMSSPTGQSKRSLFHKKLPVERNNREAAFRLPLNEVCVIV